MRANCDAGSNRTRKRSGIHSIISLNYYRWKKKKLSITCYADSSLPLLLSNRKINQIYICLNLSSFETNFPKFYPGRKFGILKIKYLVIRLNRIFQKRIYLLVFSSIPLSGHIPFLSLILLFPSSSSSHLPLLPFFFFFQLPTSSAPTTTKYSIPPLPLFFVFCRRFFRSTARTHTHRQRLHRIPISGLLFPRLFPTRPELDAPTYAALQIVVSGARLRGGKEGRGGLASKWRQFAAGDKGDKGDTVVASLLACLLAC